MAPKKFEALEVPVNSGAHGVGIKQGAIIYDCSLHDYGCANDDTRAFREHYASFTLDPEGNYPFFTLPTRCVKEIKE